MVDDASTDELSTNAIKQTLSAIENGFVIVAAKDRGGEQVLGHFDVRWDHVISLCPIELGAAEVERFVRSFDWVKKSDEFNASAFEGALQRLESLGFKHLDALLYSVCIQYRTDPRFSSAQNSTKFCEAWAREFLASQNNSANTTQLVERCREYLCTDYVGEGYNCPPAEKQLFERLAAAHPAIRYSLIGSHCFSLIERAPALIAADAEASLAPLRQVYDTSVTHAVRNCLEASIRPRDALNGLRKIIALKNVLYLPFAAYLLGRFPEHEKQNATRELIDLVEEVRRSGFKGWNGAENAKATRLAQRAVYISLPYLDYMPAAEEYTRQILGNEADASLNRGFHLEYYRDRLVSAKDGFEAFLIEDDCRTDWVNTKSTLETNLRVCDGQLSARGVVELATYCSFVSSRLERGKLSDDVRKSVRSFLDKMQNVRGAPSHVDSAVAVLRAALAADQTQFGAVSAMRLVFRLKAEVRAGWRDRNFDPGIFGGRETVASHILGTILLAYFFLPECEESDPYPYNKIRVMELLLLHDLGESIIGDRTPNEAAEDVDAEQRAVARLSLLSIFSNITNIGKLQNCFSEFESARSMEARIAKEFDCFDALIQAYLYRRHFPSEANFNKFVESYRQRIKTRPGRDILNMIESEVQHWPADLNWPHEAISLGRFLYDEELVA